MQALAANRVISVTAGEGHCLAVTETGEIFSWGCATAGQCGHGNSSRKQLLPLRVEALTCIRARSASAGSLHSLVVTEEGALHSFGYDAYGQPGHGSYKHE